MKSRFMTKGEEDTTKLLWDDYFLIRVPLLQATSMDHIRMYGNYTTLDRDIDKTLASQWLTTMQPIHYMVDHYKEGLQVKIVHYKDVKTIYEHISKHLAAWKNMLEYGINVGDAPLDDLIAMDQFANAVYEHAKFQFTPDTVSSALAAALSKTAQFNKFNFFTKPVQTSKDEVTDVMRFNRLTDPDYTDRESLGEFLKSRIVGLTSRNF
jgi:hypothetical protein